MIFVTLGLGMTCAPEEHYHAQQSKLTTMAGQHRFGAAYIAVIDRRNIPRDGVLLKVQRDGTVIELPIVLGGDSVVRNFGRTNFLVVDRRGSRVILLDRNGSVISDHQLPIGARIKDGFPVSENEVWITRAQTNTIQVLDLSTGTISDGTDLSPVLVGEAVADPEMMHMHGGRVFVQLQRLDDEFNFKYAAHGSIAVIDVESGELVDTNTGRKGVQAIELAGPAPQHKMHVTPDGTGLLVSSSGPWMRIDFSGGLERIELSELESSGLLFREMAGNFGAFTPVTGHLGIGIFHTDIIESSHVVLFSSATPAPITEQIFEELFVIIESIEYDYASRRVLMPGFNGVMNEYDPVTGVRTKRVIFDEPPGYIRDFALMQWR